MSDLPTVETREEWRDARKPILDRIEERARARLKPGDRLRVDRCGGPITVTMTGWDGRWITSAKHDDLAPCCILKINGAPADLVEADERAILDIRPPVIEDRRAGARFNPMAGLIYISAFRSEHVLCAILPEDVTPLLRALIAAHEAAERHADNAYFLPDDDEVPF